jgi:diadenosine tetraphosphate (Ap4A) HIT family hydrolase
MQCRFCNILQKSYTYGEIDKPIFENDSFFVISSLGSIIEGWVLIIPKEHTLSMKDFYHQDTFKECVNTVLHIMERQYGKIIAFEHGTNREGSLTGCGTDHAHLHLVAFPKSLINELEKSNLNWIECRPSEIQHLSGGKEYLFYTELNKTWHESKGYLSVLDFPVSQFFRKIIANYYGQIEKSNYKEFKFLENSFKTLDKLKIPA